MSRPVFIMKRHAYLILAHRNFSQLNCDESNMTLPDKTA